MPDTGQLLSAIERAETQSLDALREVQRENADANRRLIDAVHEISSDLRAFAQQQTQVSSEVSKLVSLVINQMSSGSKNGNGSYTAVQNAIEKATEKGPSFWVAVIGVVLTASVGIAGLFGAYLTPMQNDINALKKTAKELPDKIASAVNHEAKRLSDRASANADNIADNQAKLERLIEHQNEVESQIRNLGSWMNGYEQTDEQRFSELWQAVFKHKPAPRHYWPTFGRMSPSTEEGEH